MYDWPSLRVSRPATGSGRPWAYLIAAATAAVFATAALGHWMAAKIERAALEQHASAAAMYMGQFVTLLEDGRQGAPPSPATQRDLDRALATIGRRFGLAAIKIWSVDGRVLYSSAADVVVQSVSEDVAAAAAGEIVVEFDAPSAESRAEFAMFDALVEVYAPVRGEAGDVVAVVEFYVQDKRLAALLEAARIEAWALTGGLLALILGGVWALAHDGSRRLALQRSELDSRISQLSDEIARREQLRERVEFQARRTIEENARVLKLIGSDLHDGPAQLISLALLRLDALGGDPNDADVRTIRQALRESMAHIRNVSAGLLAAPEAAPGGLREEITRVVRAHEAATGVPVALDLAEAPEDCPRPVALCLRRVVQEGLANAGRHAGGVGQRVRVARAGAGVLAEVADSGPGLAATQIASPVRGDAPRLGLIGLRVRVESVGGRLEVTSAPGEGVTLTAWAPLEPA